MSQQKTLSPQQLASSLTQKEAFIFDMDGVLFDTTQVHEQAYKHALGKLTEKFVYKKYMGMSTQEALHAFLSQKEVGALLKSEKQRHALEHSHEAALYPFTKETLALLHYRGKKIILATSASRERTNAQLRAHGIDGYFHHIITADEVSVAKPAPDLYLAAQKAAGILPNKAIIIEDAISGIQSARAAGIEPLALLHTHSADDLRESYFVLKDMHSLYALLNYAFAHTESSERNILMQKRVCAIIPAAGKGKRLGTDKPKILYPLGGRTALEIMYRKILPLAEHIIVIASVEGELEIRNALNRYGFVAEIAVDPMPYGTAGSISCALERAKNYDDVLVIWGDQVGISLESLQQIIALHQAEHAGLSIPTLLRNNPYIHIERDHKGNVIDVLRKHFEDIMPDYGENDSGVFVIKGTLLYKTLNSMKEAYLRKRDITLHKPEKHEEFDFLDIIAEIAARGEKVITLPCITEEETIGYNTLDEAKFHEERVLSGKYDRYYFSQ